MKKNSKSNPEQIQHRKMKFKRESIKKKNKKTHADQARRSWSRE
jgi:hypothetical protein